MSQELIRNLGNLTPKPIEVNKKTEVPKKGAQSIFGEALSPKFGDIVEKSSVLFNENPEAKVMRRNERLRKEMEEREQKPTLEDEIIDAFILIGDGIKKGVKSLFSKEQIV